MSAWQQVGNAGSPHSAGAIASAAVEQARSAVARLVGAAPSEIIFTSGATEANNMAILGVARQVGARARSRIVVSAIEHKAVLEPARSLRQEGFDVIEAPVNRLGRVDLDELTKLVDEKTLLISIMAANNETGVLQPVTEAAAIAHRAGALIHCDAAQAVGKIPFDVLGLDLDYVSISAHKIYGPFGMGALFISASAPRPAPLVFGGGQEGGLRAGTLPAPLCVGFGVAADLAAKRLSLDTKHSHELCAQFLGELKSKDVAFLLTGGDTARVPGSLALQLTGVDGEQLVSRLARDVHFSTGSACNSGEIQASHVLRAMGLTPEQAQTSVRLFFGRYNSETEATTAARLLAEGCVAPQ